LKLRITTLLIKFQRALAFLSYTALHPIGFNCEKSPHKMILRPPNGKFIA